MLKYYIFNKPFQTLTQFSKSENKKTLSDYLNLEKDIYPIGRLDYDSEGLLILTNDGIFHNKLISPKYSHSREYLVQIENIPQENSLAKLRNGVMIGENKTKKAGVTLLKEPLNIWERTPPIRYRKNIPTSWLKIELFEGKNRQVRKMTASIGHPTLRLIRTKICFLSVEHLNPGEFRKLTREELINFKKILDLKY